MTSIDQASLGQAAHCWPMVSLDEAVRPSFRRFYVTLKPSRRHPPLHPLRVYTPSLESKHTADYPLSPMRMGPHQFVDPLRERDFTLES